MSTIQTGLTTLPYQTSARAVFQLTSVVIACWMQGSVLWWSTSADGVTWSTPGSSTVTGLTSGGANLAFCKDPSSDTLYGAAGSIVAHNTVPIKLAVGAGTTPTVTATYGTAVNEIQYDGTNLAAAWDSTNTLFHIASAGYNNVTNGVHLYAFNTSLTNVYSYGGAQALAIITARPYTALVFNAGTLYVVADNAFAAQCYSTTPSGSAYTNAATVGSILHDANAYHNGFMGGYDGTHVVFAACRSNLSTTNTLDFFSLTGTTWTLTTVDTSTISFKGVQILINGSDVWLYYTSFTNQANGEIYSAKRTTGTWGSPAAVSSLSGDASGYSRPAVTPSQSTGTLSIVAAKGTANPWSLINATSTLSSALTPGTLSHGTVLYNSVPLSLATNAGGTAPYSNQLQRAPDVSGSPGSWANLQAPQTGATASWTDSTVAASTTYWYRVVVTDSAGSPATANSNQISATTPAPPALAAGTISLTSATASTVNLTATAATGGVPSYTYQWYRSLTSGFTPGGGNILAGQTGLTLADTPPDSQLYFYKVKATDSASSTVNYTQGAGKLWRAQIILGAIGDSIALRVGMASWPLISIIARHLTSLGAGMADITVRDSGVTGTTTADWLPTAAGGAGNAYNTAKTLFTGIGANLIDIALGTNDARLLTPSQFNTNLTAIITQLITDFPSATVVVHYPPYFVPFGAPGNTNSAYTEAANTNLQLILPQIDAVVAAFAISNPGKVLAGDKLAWSYFATHPEELTSETMTNSTSPYNTVNYGPSDGIHPHEVGVEKLALLRAQAIAAAFIPPASGAGRRRVW